MRGELGISGLFNCQKQARGGSASVPISEAGGSKGLRGSKIFIQKRTELWNSDRINKGVVFGEHTGE